MPPSIANTTTGKGFITFQIKPKPNYAIGDIIDNTANIYFDFNPAIVTNVCRTEFVSVLSNQNFAFKNFNYAPNPVTNILTVSSQITIDEIEISTILGQIVLSKNVKGLQSEINLSSFSSGIYLMKITIEGTEKTIKIVKE